MMKAHPPVLTLFCLLVLSLCLPLQARAQASKSYEELSENMRLYTLGNGVRLIVQQASEAPLVAIDFWVGAGSARETPDTNGCAHFLEHLIFKGSERQGPGAVDKLVESSGATLNAGTDRDWAHYYTTVASRYWEGVFTSVSEALLRPALSVIELEKERRVILDEISRDDDAPFRASLRRLFKEACANSSYALPITGTAESVKKLTRDDVKAFHERWYAGSNLTVVLVGNLDFDQAFNLFKAQFSSAPPLKRVLEMPSLPAMGKRLQERSPFDEGVIAFSFPTPPAKDEKECLVMDVISVLIADPSIGRIPHDLLTLRPMASAVKAYSTTTARSGVFGVMATAKPANLPAVETAIEEHLKRLRDERISSRELKSIVNRLMGISLFESETYGGRAQAYGFYATVSSIEFPLRYKQMLDEVTPSEIQDVARRYLDPSLKIVLKLDNTDAPVSPNNGAVGQTSPSGASASQSSTPSFAAVPAGAGKKVSTAPARSEPVKLIMPNNMAMVLQPESQSQLVSFNVFIRAGAAQEPKGLSGLSNVVAHALFNTTENANRNQLRQLIQSLGGEIEMIWRPDYTQFTITTTKDNLFNAQSFFADVLKNSTFDEDTVKKAIKQTLVYLEATSGGSIFRSTYEALCTKLYPKHPYAFPYGGNAEEIKKVKLKDVQDFFNVYYNPKNMVISVAGRVSQGEVLQQFERVFGHVEREGEIATPISAPNPLDSPQNLTIKKRTRSAYVLIGFALPGVKSADYPAAVVLNAILGEGKSSRLFSRLREAGGVGYEVGSALQPMRMSSQLLSFLQFTPSSGESALTPEKARDQMLTIINGLLTEPPTDDEMERARRFCIGSHALKHQRVRERAEWLGFWEANGMLYQQDEEFPARLESVTKEDVMRLARTYLKNPVTVLTLPTDQK